MNYVIIVIFILLHYYFTSNYHNRIRNTPVFNNTQKNIHIVLIWIIPFIWFWIIKGIITPSETMTKHKRKTDITNYYESGKGVDM